MKTRPHDPLLSFARLVMLFGMGLMIAIVLGSMASASLMALSPQATLARLAARGIPPETLWGVYGIVGLAGAGALLAFFFLSQLKRVVGTVAEGDPFVPVNARRLQTMGWIAAAEQVLSIPLAGLFGWIAYRSSNPHPEYSLSFGGLIMAVVLFILARVFREGAAMREELEGTV